MFKAIIVVFMSMIFFPAKLGHLDDNFFYVNNLNSTNTPSMWPNPPLEINIVLMMCIVKMALLNDLEEIWTWTFSLSRLRN